jgi:hypothetical protein
VTSEVYLEGVDTIPRLRYVVLGSTLIWLARNSVKVEKTYRKVDR